MIGMSEFNLSDYIIKRAIRSVHRGAILSLQHLKYLYLYTIKTV